MEPTGQDGNQTLGPVIQIDESKVQAHLDRMVRDTVQETLNATLDAEADQPCRAKWSEHSKARKDTRARLLRAEVADHDG